MLQKICLSDICCHNWVNWKCFSLWLWHEYKRDNCQPWVYDRSLGLTFVTWGLQLDHLLQVLPNKKWSKYNHQITIFPLSDTSGEILFLPSHNMRTIDLLCLILSVWDLFNHATIPHTVNLHILAKLNFS